MLAAYAEAVIIDATPRIREDAVRGTFGKDLLTALAAAFIYTLLLIGSRRRPKLYTPGTTVPSMPCRWMYSSRLRQSRPSRAVADRRQGFSWPINDDGTHRLGIARHSSASPMATGVGADESRKSAESMVVAVHIALTISTTFAPGSTVISRSMNAPQASRA